MNQGRCSACLLRTLPQWGIDVKAYVAAVAKARREAHTAWLTKAYGMANPQYDALFIQQDGVCAICGEAETRQTNGLTHPLSVDHSHTTGVTRALLCSQCNLALGQVETMGLLWVRKAVQYLKMHMSASEQARFVQ
jgi:hypothetical protein